MSKRKHLLQIQPSTNPADNFDGVYELTEIYDPNFKRGDLRKYEQIRNYKIVTMDGGQIWLNDTEKLFKKQGTFVLDEVDELETDWGLLLDTALLEYGQLIIKEIQSHGDQEDPSKIVCVYRTHQFFGNHLIVNDYNDSWGADAINKKYLRV